MSEAKGFVAKVDNSHWVRDGSHDSLGLKAPHGATRDIPVLSPVYVLPLDPDGPLPGQKWMWRGKRVTVVDPLITADGDVHYWIKYADGRVGAVAPQHLSPIPRTRTVTVELTEDERRFVATTLSDRDPIRPVTSIFAKLAAALEDIE